MGHKTRDPEVVGLTRDQVAIKWLVFGCVTVRKRVNRLGI